MLAHRLESVCEVARRAGAGAALLSDPAPLRWIGVERPHGVHVLVSGGDAVVIERRDPRSAREALEHALGTVGLEPTDTVAIDSPAPPPVFASAIPDRCWADASFELAAIRARKEAEEIELIAHACELVVAGHGALRARLAAGVTERELWEAAELAMCRTNRALVEAGVDLMAGDRTTRVGAPPTERIVRPGEPVLFDLAPLRNGYWADSCATVACGKPARALRRRHDAVRTALERGLRAARPGVTTGFVDREIRAELARAGLECPHHTGHGVGTASQEPPWLIPGGDTFLEEGMVVAMEPGAYSKGIGVRLEHLVVVCADGVRPLTTHSIELT